MSTKGNNEVNSSLKKMLMSKKAISPILATLLLIVIAVAAVIVTYAWVMTFTGSQTQQAGVLLVKENVSWPTSSSITVVIRNTGTSNGKIMAIYIGTSSTNLTSATVATPSMPATVNSGSSQSFTLTYTWAANTRYYFKFSTDTPAILEFNEKSP
jgi:flagellin-like protein